MTKWQQAVQARLLENNAAMTTALAGGALLSDVILPVVAGVLLIGVR